MELVAVLENTVGVSAVLIYPLIPFESKVPETRARSMVGSQPRGVKPLGLLIPNIIVPLVGFVYGLFESIKV